MWTRAARPLPAASAARPAQTSCFFWWARSFPRRPRSGHRWRSRRGAVHRMWLLRWVMRLDFWLKLRSQSGQRRALARCGCAVGHQVGLLAERLAALRAGVRLLAGVDAPVRRPDTACGGRLFRSLRAPRRASRARGRAGRRPGGSLGEAGRPHPRTRERHARVQSAPLGASSCQSACRTPAHAKGRRRRAAAGARAGAPAGSPAHSRRRCGEGGASATRPPRPEAPARTSAGSGAGSGGAPGARSGRWRAAGARHADPSRALVGSCVRQQVGLVAGGGHTRCTGTASRRVDAPVEVQVGAYW